MASDKSIDQYGFIKNMFIREKEDAKKATSRNSALYDVTNGFIVDFTMGHWTDSEIPLLVQQLERSHELFKNHPSIVLADRYYPSVELFSILEHYGMNYCIRGKSNFFKKQLEGVQSNDTWIEVEIDKI